MIILYDFLFDLFDFLDFSNLFDFLNFLGFLDFWKLLRLLQKVTSEHQKWPKVSQNSVISSFFVQRAKKVSAEG